MSDIIQTKEVLKEYFQTGDKPTETQYRNLIESLRHMHDKISLDDFNLNGYDEEGTRESNLIVKLGDFDDSNNGTKIELTDSLQEVKVSGNLNIENGEATFGGLTTFSSYARGKDFVIGSDSGNNIDSGSLYFQENINGNWGSNAYGFRHSLDGSTNTYYFQSGNETTINNLFSVGRDSGNFIFNRNISAPAFIGDGSGLTGITSGQLPSNAAYTDSNNNFTVGQTITGNTIVNGELQINDAGTIVSQFSSTDNTSSYLSVGGTATTQYDVRFGAINNDASIWAGGGEKYSINSSGDHDFKDGTAAFGNIVKINSSADAKLQLIVDPNDTNDWNYISFNGADGLRDAFVGTGSSGEFKIGNSNTGEEFIMSNFGGANFSGSLATQGLLTSSEFTVEGDDAGVKIIRTNPSIGFDPYILLGDGIVSAQIRADRSSNGDIYFTTQNAVNEVFRIADSGDVTADNFIGNWNGKTATDYVSISGDETITGNKIFTQAISAPKFRPTNIVTDKIVKFNGLEFDDSSLSDDGTTLTSSADIDASGQTVTADNFTGNWNGKTESDFMRATGAVNQIIDGDKTFDGAIILQDELTSNSPIVTTSTAEATDFIGNWNGKTESDFMRATGSLNEEVVGIKTFEDGIVVNSLLSADNITANTLAGNGALITNVNATTIDSLDSSDFMRATGNVTETITGEKNFSSIKLSDFATLNFADRLEIVSSSGSTKLNLLQGNIVVQDNGANTGIQIDAVNTKITSPNAGFDKIEVGNNTTQGEIDFFDESTTPQAKLYYNEEATEMRYENLEGGHHSFTTDIIVNGDVNANNFIGNWNGKTESDFMRATGDVTETITGEKIFNSNLTSFGTTGQLNSIELAGDTLNWLTITHNNTNHVVSFEFKGSGSFSFGGDLESDKFSLKSLNTSPTSSTDTGITGEIRYTADYIYVCTATDTWKRAALSTW